MADGRRTVRTRRVSSRYYDAPYGYGYGYDSLFGGFFRAAAQAMAEVIVGTSRVAGNLIVDASDSVFGRRYAADYDYEYEDEGVEAEAEGEPVETVDYEEEEEDVRDVRYVRGVSVCDSVDRAFVESSRIFSRSAQRFADELDAERRPVRRRRRTRVVRDPQGGTRVEVKTETQTTKAPGTPIPVGTSTPGTSKP